MIRPSGVTCTEQTGVTGHREVARVRADRHGRQDRHAGRARDRAARLHADRRGIQGDVRVGQARGRVSLLRRVPADDERSRQRGRPTGRVEVVARFLGVDAHELQPALRADQRRRRQDESGARHRSRSRVHHRHVRRRLHDDDHARVLPGHLCSGRGDVGRSAQLRSQVHRQQQAAGLDAPRRLRAARRRRRQERVADLVERRDEAQAALDRVPWRARSSRQADQPRRCDAPVDRRARHRSDTRQREPRVADADRRLRLQGLRKGRQGRGRDGIDDRTSATARR